jgi:hypothetical protein
MSNVTADRGDRLSEVREVDLKLIELARRGGRSTNDFN